MRSSLPQRIAGIGFRVGLCFHVGSQIEDTDTYERALASAAWVRSRPACRSPRSISAAAFRPPTATIRDARSRRCRRLPAD